MSLGLVVQTGRVLMAKLLLGQAVDGITHCAIGDGESSFTSAQCWRPTLGRAQYSTMLSVDQSSSGVGFFSSLAMLRGNEAVLTEQSDWSEERKINPYMSTAQSIALAQTFSFTQNRVISSIGLHFTAADPSIPVTVQIRSVTTGLPNEEVLAEKVLAPSEISLSGETRIRFDDPFYAEANTSYAVVLLTNSTNYWVRSATLDKMGRWGVITRQAYTESMVLESPNAEYWTLLNSSCLAMEIYSYNFQTNGVVHFQPITGVQFSYISLGEYSTTHKGTSLDWEYSTDSGATWNALVPAKEERLPNIATRVQIRVHLGSSLANDTPFINFRDVNLVGGLDKSAEAYKLTQGVESTKVCAQIQIPSFIDQQDPPAPNIHQTGLRNECARKRYYKRTFLKEDSEGALLVNGARYLETSEETNTIGVFFRFNKEEANGITIREYGFFGGSVQYMESITGDLAMGGVFHQGTNQTGEVLHPGYLYEVKNIPDFNKMPDTCVEMVGIFKI